MELKRRIDIEIEANRYRLKEIPIEIKKYKMLSEINDKYIIKLNLYKEEMEDIIEYLGDLETILRKL